LPCDFRCDVRADVERFLAALPEDLRLLPLA
jgi:hypothetical protein